VAISQRKLEDDLLLFFYTDGVTEALDPESNLYGEVRLERLLGNARLNAAKACVDLVVGDVESFARSAPQADDLTLVALCRVRQVATG